MVSESAARQWLSEVKIFRQEWAQFAVHSREHFDAFRDRGASLPDSFLVAYAELQKRKASISARITDRTQQVGIEDWAAPLPTDALHEFEHRLNDLIDICRELDRIAADKRSRFQQTLTCIRKLYSTDVEVDGKLCLLRQDADSELRLLATQPMRIADLDLEKRISGLEALLALVNDARTRNQSCGAPSPRIEAAQVVQVFLSVQDQFGPTLAVEALRSGFVPTIWRTEVVEGDGEVPNTARTQTDADQGSPQCIILFDNEHSSSAPPTSEQISQLLKRHSSPGPQAMPSARRPTLGNPPQGLNDRVSICDLVTSAESLKHDAEVLDQGTGTAERLQGTQEVRRIRARGFRNLATILKLTADVFGEGEQGSYLSGSKLFDFLLLIAESQSAVRVEALRSGIAAIPEQETAFKWLRYTCSQEEEGIMLNRFMRLDDHADPAGHADLQRRILTFCKPISLSIQNHKDLHELRSCQKKILADSQQVPGEPNLQLWMQIDSLTTSLVRNGIRHNDTRLRQILLPIIDLLPEQSAEDATEEVTPGIEVSLELQAVAESIADYLKQQNEEVHEDSDADLLVSAELQNARLLLRDKVMVIIGGVCKPHAQQRLIKSLQVKDVRWLRARKQDKVSDFKAKLTGAAVVVLITKIMGHKHNDVREMCDELKIPYVQTRYAAGYSVNQLVSVILDQASDRLAAQLP